MLTAHESPVQREAVSSNMKDRGQSNIVLICRTCPRDRPRSGEVGLALYDEMKERLAGQGMAVMMVHCLGSCRTPCAVAFDAPAKPRVRLSGLNGVNALDLIDAALGYQRTASGDVSVAMLPTLLQQHVTAISPKRQRSAA